MRYVYMGLIAILAGIVVMFKFQNMESATVSLFSMSVTMPVSRLVVLVYILGMLTGGLVLALVRTWITRARRSPGDPGVSRDA
jgi:uncharacterized integral membrane protein